MKVSWGLNDFEKQHEKMRFLFIESLEDNPRTNDKNKGDSEKSFSENSQNII